MRVICMKRVPVVYSMEVKLSERQRLKERFEGKAE